MIRRRPIITLPDRVPKSRSGGANIRMRIMSVDAPRLQDAFHESFMARAPDVIDDLVASVLLQRFADLPRDVVENLVPRDLLPSAVATLAFAPHRIQDP